LDFSPIWFSCLYSSTVSPLPLRERLMSKEVSRDFIYYCGPHTCPFAFFFPYPGSSPIDLFFGILSLFRNQFPTSYSPPCSILCPEYFLPVVQRISPLSILVILVQYQMEKPFDWVFVWFVQTCVQISPPPFHFFLHHIQLCPNFFSSPEYFEYCPLFFIRPKIFPFIL